MSEISFFTNKLDFKISNEKEIVYWLESIAKSESKSIGVLNIIFMSDEELLEMNKSYLKHDYYTDIITFPIEGRHVGGELYLSIDRIKDNASELGNDFSDELHRVLAHGLLHLLSYDDKTKEQKIEMKTREEFCLNLRHFNVPRETK